MKLLRSLFSRLVVRDQPIEPDLALTWDFGPSSCSLEPIRTYYKLQIQAYRLKTIKGALNDGRQ